MSIKITSQITALILLISLVACGESEPINQVSAQAPKKSEAIKPTPLNLSSTPLNKQVYLGNMVTDEIKAAPCPFLSDETAVATAKTNWILKRRETSHNSCYWSKNAGFSIKVSIEPKATAKPVKEHAYNIDSPPILKKQQGPGNSAVILYDTAWDKEQAYAMSFEKDDQQVMIFVTGMSTDEQRLTATAQEIANKLTNTQLIDTNVHSSQNNTGTFNLCSTWSTSDIEAIIGAPLQLTSGNLDCKWQTGTGDDLKQVRVTIYSGKSYAWDYLKELGAVDIAELGERAMLDHKRKRKNMPAHALLNALYDEKIVTVTVTDTIDNHKAVAFALSKNIDSRLQ